MGIYTVGACLTAVGTLILGVHYNQQLTEYERTPPAGMILTAVVCGLVWPALGVLALLVLLNGALDEEEEK